MRMSRAAISCVAAVLLLGVTATSVQAGEPAPDPGPATGILVNGEYHSLADMPDLFPEDESAPSNPSVVVPFLLDPVDLTACNVLNATNHEIRRIDDVRAGSFFGGGSMSLTCGNSSFGYRHIRDRHEADWRNRLIQAGTPTASWDDYMFYVSWLTLLDPNRIYDHGGGKLCYTSHMVMLGDNMEPIVQYDSTVVLSTTGRWIITSFPGGGCRG